MDNRLGRAFRLALVRLTGLLQNGEQLRVHVNSEDCTSYLLLKHSSKCDLGSNQVVGCRLRHCRMASQPSRELGTSDTAGTP